MQLSNDFFNDAEDSDYELIPNGEYPLLIEDINDKMPRSETSKAGAMVEITFKVIEGDFAKRKIWELLCVNHEKKRAANIARAQLRDIAKACGIPKEQFTSTDQILGRKITGKIITTQNEGYKPKNVIERYYEHRELAPAKPVDLGDDDIPF